MLETVDRVRITHKNVPLNLVASPEGLDLLAQNPQVLDLFTNRTNLSLGGFFRGDIHLGSRGYVVKSDVGESEPGKLVAVKHFYLQDRDLNAQEQFAIMEAFRELGFSCATPLLATDRRLISEWVNGFAPGLKRWDTEEQYKYITYIDEINYARKYLRREIVPNKKWEVDDFRENYRQNPELNLNDPKTYFIAIDPVFV